MQVMHFVLVLVSYNNQDVPTFHSVKMYCYIYI